MKPRTRTNKPIPPAYAPITGSAEQEAIFAGVISAPMRSIVVNALAGTGKSTTIAEIAYRLRNTGLKLEYTSFGKANQEEMQAKAGKYLTAVTLHSMGKQLLEEHFGRLKVWTGNGRIWRMVSTRFDSHMQDVKSAAVRICGIAKQYAQATPEYLKELVDHHDIELDGADLDKSVELAIALLNAMCDPDEIAQGIDFDDMCWLPVIMGLEFRPDSRPDILAVDEMQDLNAVGQILASKRCNVLYVVGDPYQAIYGFRGALNDAFSIMRGSLISLGAKEYPLTVSRRCSQEVARCAQVLVPSFKALPGAPMGSMEKVAHLPLEFPSGSMIVARTNAPLVSTAYKLMRKNKRVCMLGRDLGDNIARLIRSYVQQLRDLNRPADMLEVVRLSREFTNAAVAKYEALLRPGQTSQRAASAVDRHNCIESLAKCTANVSMALSALRDMFSPHKDAIVLGTVFKVKGLEADHVFVIRGDLMPHPRAVQEWQVEQELHALYVGITRARKSLYFVETVPKPLERLFKEPDQVERDQEQANEAQAQQDACAAEQQAAWEHEQAGRNQPPW